MPAAAIRPKPAPLALVRILGIDAELDALQNFLQGIPATTRVFIGDPEARHLFSMLPPGKGADAKFLYGVYEGGELIGCLDLIRGYPDARYAYVGLLVLSQDRRGRGIGGAVWDLAEAAISSWDGVDRVRLGVTVGNASAEKFWKKMGFAPTGEVSVSDGGSGTLCALFEKKSGTGSAKDRHA